MNTANLNYGKLIYISDYDRYKYIFYYSAENQYLCCFLKNSYFIRA